MIEALKIAGPLLLIATAFILLAGLAKAAVDIMSHQADNNIFIRWGAWFDVRTSWKRKYKDYDRDGENGPAAFIGAKGPLVALTDFWHAADFVYLKAYLLGAGFGAVGIYRAGGAWWAYAAGLVWSAIVMGAVFELTYRRSFRINKRA